MLLQGQAGIRARPVTGVQTCAPPISVSEVLLTTVTFVAAVPPRLTVAPAAKPVPVTVTAVPPLLVSELGEIALTVGAEAREGCNSRATAPHEPEVFMVTAFVTGDGMAAVLSFTAAPTVVVAVKLPLSRRLPVLGEKVVAFFSPNPATTQLLPLRVVSVTVGFAFAELLLVLRPNAPTPEYSAT